ncbi:MAG: hypothetical protein K0S33_117 [Bacteroidetes bacterium]|jgi:tetratricopeptide (TPR) repeat protein|nr:hypothetical protein [Bacteroidota bacterium]
MKHLSRSRILLTVVAVTIFLSGIQAQDQKIIQAFTKSYQNETSKDYNNAISSLKAVYDSTSYEINLRLGWLSYKAGFSAASLKYYEKAVALSPKSVEARIGYNYPAYAIYNTDNIIAQGKNILELDPNNTQVLYQLGYIYFHKNDFKTAEAYFKKLLDLYPFDYDGLSMSAQVQTRLGNAKEAHQYLSRLLLFSPNDQTAKEEVELLKLDLKNDEKIEEAFYKSYEMSTKDNNAGAIEALQTVYDKDCYEINLRLGYLCFLSKKHKESLEYYKIAMALKPKALEPHFGYVYPANALGLNEDLCEHYRAILAIDPFNSVANYRLGYLSYQKKDFITADACFRKVVTMYPFSYDGLIMYAKTSFDMGKKTEAAALFKRVLLLSANDKEATAALNALK